MQTLANCLRNLRGFVGFSILDQNEKRTLKHPRYVGDSEPTFAVKSACSEMFGCAEREIMTCGHCEILQPVPQCEMKFAHIREANISHAAGVFHISQKYFTCP